jgi:hypothetical protein
MGGMMLSESFRRPKVVIAAVLLAGGIALGTAPAVTAGARLPGRMGPSVVRRHIVTWQFGALGCSGDDCGQYLQIRGAETGNGAWAEIRKGPGDNNEKWYAILLNHSQYAFQNLNSHKCLNDRNGHLTGHVDQWSCGRYPSDNRWSQVPAGLSRTFALQSVSNGFAACVISSRNRWVVFGATGSGLCFWH